MNSLISRRIFVKCRNYISVLSQRTLCDNKDNKNKKNDKLDDVLGAIASKYQVFRDEDSSTILDINEERFKYAQFIETHEELDTFAGINLNSTFSY